MYRAEIITNDGWYRMEFWEIDTQIRVLVGPPRRTARSAAHAARQALLKMLDAAYCVEVWH